jgi:pilus assembly protein CpaC
MAVSGQEGSFLAGGKIFIPVSRVNNGSTTFELEEKDFGVSLKFIPTVLADGRINLRVNPEVSELNRQGVGISAPGVAGMAILPSFTVRRASTTVQLFDGQSFAIGGLIKSNVAANIKAFPLLGELPIIGAPFRSSDFRPIGRSWCSSITPRLVKPLPRPSCCRPTTTRSRRARFYFDGKLEGSRKETPSTEAQVSANDSQTRRTAAFVR